ncbi:MAG: hypothetical protein NC548_28180 [Lachnospiraceae bacterium]|nr:hypothetical protein [Lachnospiraceae bacterium]
MVTAKKINIKEAFFHLGIYLEFISQFLSTVVFVNGIMNNFSSIIHGMSFGLLAVSIIINNRHTRRQLLLLALCSCVGVLNYYVSGNATFVTLVLVAYAAKEYNFTLIIRKLLLLRIVLLGLTIFLSLGGVAIGYVSHRTGGDRFSLGFDTPNRLGLNLCAILIYSLYLYRKLSLKKLLILGVGVYILSFFSGAQTSAITFLVTFVLIICCKFFKWDKIDSRLLKGLLKNMYLIMLLFSIAIALLYRRGYTIFIVLNRLLSRRLYFFDYYLQNFNISLFGNAVLFQTEGWDYSLGQHIPLLTLDNAYLYYLFASGLVGCVFYFLFSRKVMQSLLETDDVYGVICAFGLLFSGLSEISALDVNFNHFLLLSFCESDRIEKRSSSSKLQKPANVAIGGVLEENKG